MRRRSEPDGANGIAQSVDQEKGVENAVLSEPADQVEAGAGDGAHQRDRRGVAQFGIVLHRAGPAAPGDPRPEAIHIQIDHGRSVQGQ